MLNGTSDGGSRLGLGKCVMIQILSATILAGACSCSSLPPLDEQASHVLNHDIQLDKLTSEAFWRAWGPPTYEHRQRTQFYPVKNGNLIPQFRVPLGEPPDDWQSAIVLSEMGYFMAYAERGELLGFIEDRLVFHEQAPADEIHAVGKAWANQRMFRTRLE